MLNMLNAEEKNIVTGGNNDCHCFLRNGESAYEDKRSPVKCADWCCIDKNGLHWVLWYGEYKGQHQPCDHKTEKELQSLQGKVKDFVSALGALTLSTKTSL